MWLIERETIDKMNAAIKSGVTPTADQMSAMIPQAIDGEQRNLTIAGDVANISVKGVLTDTPDFFARFFGGGNTVYNDIIGALAAADANPEVKRAELEIDSPGGTASAAWQATMDAIASFNKPITAMVRGRALSAAYGIAAMADEIVGMNNLSAFGSIGVVVAMRVDETIVEITSTNSPDKRPDPTTSAGQKVIRAQLDQIEDQFIDMIAQGRGTNNQNVKSNFGRGSVLLATEAEKRGMIDSVLAKTKIAVKSNNKPKAITATGRNQGVKIMDLTTLKAEHPDAYAAAVQVGVTQEGERVQAHLTLANAYGADAMDIAIECINGGKDCGQLEQAKYIAAGAKANTLAVHAEGDEAAAAALKAKKEAETDGGETFEASIAKGVADLMGAELAGA